MRRLALAFVAVVGGASAGADTRSVALVVTDGQGAFVDDIRPAEVRVLENGEPRELVSFARDDRRLAVVLVLDTSTGAAQVFRTQAFDAVFSLVSRLPQESSCTLWTTGDRPRKIGVLEGGRPQVEKKVAQGFGLDGPNALLDTLVEAAASLGRESGRRRALVAVSGAGAGHTAFSLGGVSAQVRRGEARVLAVMYREGHGAAAGSLFGLDVHRDDANLTMVGPAEHERALSGLARATGGRFESVPTTLGVSRLLESFGAELAGQYRLRYAGSDTKGPRQVDVRLSRPGVRWRVAVDSP